MLRVPGVASGFSFSEDCREGPGAVDGRSETRERWESLGNPPGIERLAGIGGTGGIASSEFTRLRDGAF